MTTLIFPGQGSQFKGMAKDFYDEFDIVRDTFEIIENSSKINVKEIIFGKKQDLLDITQYTQIAIFTVSISIYNALIKNIGFEKLRINYFACVIY